MTRHTHSFRLPRWQFLLTAALLAIAQTTATAQPQPAPKNILRVLTYNIRYDNPAVSA